MSSPVDLTGPCPFSRAKTAARVDLPVPAGSQRLLAGTYVSTF